MADIKSLLKKKQGENNDEYLYRLGAMREMIGYSWEKLAIVINKETGLDRSEAAYRKKYKAYTLSVEAQGKTIEPDSETLDIVTKEKLEIREQKVQHNATMRVLQREQSIKDIARETAEIISQRLPLIMPKKEKAPKKSKAEAILVISDWHYGILVDTYWNKYSPDIARERIRELTNETINYCLSRGINRLHILNLGDLICGRIHLQLRLQSRYDTITQVMEVAEILAEMIQELSVHFEIEYYDCDDNHSRIEPNKKEHIQLETLVRIIRWYLIKRFENRKDIHINNNEYGDDIITFNIFDHKIAAVHGHKDKPNKITANLSLMTQEHFDLIISAHLHHFISNEQNYTLHISNGSLMGADLYATDLRLTNKPSQNIIIATQDNVANEIHRVILNG